MKKVRNHAVKMVNSITLGADDAITVNLVGHCRGAVSCLMIAYAHYREGKALGDASKYRCNLFLIDAVKVTGILATGMGVPNRETQFIYENVGSLIHIVMEDNTNPLFILYDIWERPLGEEIFTSVRNQIIQQSP